MHKTQNKISKIENQNIKPDRKNSDDDSKIWDHKIPDVK